MDVDLIIQDLDSAEGAMRRPVRDIYNDDGRERFVQLERTACDLIARRQDSPIVSTGGGLCDNPAAVEAVRNGLIIHLVDDVDILVWRALRGGLPAYLSSTTMADAKVELADVFRRRIELYDRMAHATIEIAGADQSIVADRVMSAVRGAR